MKHWHGRRSAFCLEIGKCHSDIIREFDIWVAHECLTKDDNHALVPAIITAIKGELGGLLGDPELYPRERPISEESYLRNHRRLCESAEHDNRDYLKFRFLDLAEISDPFSLHLFEENGVSSLVFSMGDQRFESGSEGTITGIAELPEWELRSILHEALWSLQDAWEEMKENHA